MINCTDSHKLSERYIIAHTELKTAFHSDNNVLWNSMCAYCESWDIYVMIYIYVMLYIPWTQYFSNATSRLVSIQRGSELCDFFPFISFTLSSRLRTHSFYAVCHWSVESYNRSQKKWPFDKNNKLVSVWYEHWPNNNGNGNGKEVI